MIDNKESTRLIAQYLDIGTLNKIEKVSKLLRITRQYSIISIQ